MTTPTTTFFLSSGRCGTQWLTRHLQRIYGDVADVVHEPIHSGYRPRNYFRAFERLDEMLEDPIVHAHVERIRTRIDRGRTYVETGWPSYAAVPLFAELFPGDVGLVQLVRHPVPTALSLASTIWKFDAPGWGPEKWQLLSLPDPSSTGAVECGYEDWETLTPYEHCLFWWTQVHLYAEELHERLPDVPFTRLRAEALFAGDTPSFETLTSFIGLPWRPAVLRSRAVDAFGGKSAGSTNWELIRKYPVTMDLARALGYDPEDVDTKGLERRYERSFLKRLATSTRSRLLRGR